MALRDYCPLEARARVELATRRFTGSKITTYPVAVMQQEHGTITAHPCFDE